MIEAKRKREGEREGIKRERKKRETERGTERFVLSPGRSYS